MPHLQKLFLMRTTPEQAAMRGQGPSPLLTSFTYRLTQVGGNETSDSCSLMYIRQYELRRDSLGMPPTVRISKRLHAAKACRTTGHNDFEQHFHHSVILLHSHHTPWISPHAFVQRQAYSG